MNKTIIKFHVRSIARSVKSIFKNILGLEAPLPNLDQTTAAWHQPPAPDHPSLLCRCPETDGEVAFDAHLPDCPWKAQMCVECEGTGICSACGGDGCCDPADCD